MEVCGLCVNRAYIACQTKPLASAIVCAAEPDGVITVTPEQPEKASAAISVTLAGIVISSRSVQPAKAREPMVVQPSGMTTTLAVLPANASSEMTLSAAGRVKMLKSSTVIVWLAVWPPRAVTVMVAVPLPTTFSLPSTVGFTTAVLEEDNV